MSDELCHTWVYQEILKEGREEERKRLEEEQHKRLEEERTRELEGWRQTMLGHVQARFANQKMALLAEGQASIIKDPKILQDLIVKVGSAQTAEEAQDYLLSWRKAS